MPRRADKVVESHYSRRSRIWPDGAGRSRTEVASICIQDGLFSNRRERSPLASEPCGVAQAYRDRCLADVLKGGGQNVLGTSTRSVPSRTLSGRVVRCRLVFGRGRPNSPKQNPAYSPPSAHLRIGADRSGSP